MQFSEVDGPWQEIPHWARFLIQCGFAWSDEADTLQRWCDDNDDPNGPITTGQFNPTAATTGVDSPLGGWCCDQTKFPYPLRHEFKFAGNYNLPFGLDFGVGVLQPLELARHQPEVIRHNNKVLTFHVNLFNVLNCNALRTANNNVRSSSRQRDNDYAGTLPAAGVQLQV